MKKYLSIILLFGCLIISEKLNAQNLISGVVKDKNGPLIGATVHEKGVTDNGTITNDDGSFELNLEDQSDSIVISMIGYIKRVIRPLGTGMEILMHRSSQGLDEVMVIGYGKTNRITNTGAVSSIKADKIRDVPTSSVQNALTGKIPGFFSQQRSGQPGKDASDFFIRGVSSLNPAGNKPLIIVDGVEYTYEQLSQINVNEIESISVLKDASSTAIYGIKGANGVLIVKTRRGHKGRPQINVRIESGMQSPVKTPVFLNSYHSALLVNQARENDGLSPKFSKEEIAHFKSMDNPYKYPYVDWYNEIYKPYSMQYNANIDVSGGNDVIRYFISGGAFRQNGNVRNFEDKYDAGNRVVNSNYYYRRYTFRSNIDVQASKNLSLKLDLTGRFYQINEPRAGNIVSEVYDWSKIHPYSAAFINPNGSYTYATDTKDRLPTINARLATQGYSLQKRHDMNVLFQAKEDLSDLTDGLSFSIKTAYASVESSTREQARDEDIPTYLYDPVTGKYSLHGSAYVLGNYTLRAYQGDYNDRLNIQAFFDYDRAFGDHHVSSLLLLNRESYLDKNAGWIPSNFKGFSFRAGYEYKGKYLFNFVASYNGSDRFRADKRYGFFPAVSVGYNIAKESFFKEAVHFVDLLKIRGSYGVVGSDVTPGSRYLYDQTYDQGGAYSFGETNDAQSTITEGDLGNPDVTWEKQRELDIGLDMNLFDSKFSLTIDYFNNMRYDQLTTPQSIPLILGVGVSPENIAKVRNKGFDGELTYNNSIGKVNYNIDLVFSYARNKILYMDEATPTYPWLAVTGHPIGQPFGYTSLGFYQNQKDIDHSALPNTSSVVVPGDLKYKDLNDDGVIDQYDKKAIGNPNLPNSTAGLTLGVNYKGFNLSLLFQGAWGYSLSVVGTGIQPFQSQFQPIHQLAWTKENAEKARFPRLTTNPTTINSPAAYMSDFWLIDVVYIRLKTLELGYQLPDRWLPLRINNARFYLSSYNLVTWKNYSLYQQDPEVASNTAGDAYLNQRVVNVGLQIGF